MSGICPCPPLAPFIYDLNGVDASVVLDRDKRKHKLTLRVRLERVKYFANRTVLAAGLLENIEIAQQCYAVHIDVKNAVTRAAPAGFLGPNQVSQNNRVAVYRPGTTGIEYAKFP